MSDAKPGCVLIVDDHKTNRMKMAFGIKNLGHTVEMAENGRQALEILRAQAIDLVLLDIVMPEMDGFQVLETMKRDKVLRNIPVIVISAETEMEQVVKGIELGAEDYLPKSFDPVLFKARVEACLEKKRLRDNEQLYLRGLERELQIGQRIQRSFLPDSLPQPPGWEIAAHFQAAKEVAGDFYDAFWLSRQEKIGVVLGDVCGKGVGAALFMTLFRSLIRAVANLDDFIHTDLSAAAANNLEPEAVVVEKAVTLTNNYICHNHQQANMFSTLFFGLLDPMTGRMVYTNAGQEPPLILSSKGDIHRLDITNPVIGIIPGIKFNIREIWLHPGDTLLAYTDGITEAFNPEGQMFSEHRLEALLNKPIASAAALLELIAASVDTYMGSSNQSDDITMIAVRRLTDCN
ncbi:MAG TPA: SpoIIE family protein phosphatase [Anaerolineae bacterium]|nr:SpoIIE family protein phosphatase [Anaerolineae bacterium]MCB0222231.1 SpoIIE family protein phosphatase [Anaerolineae bacterium]HRV91694.1 SpoIIE family protein phosphatase [Anaerolineae bacterium]